MELAEWMDQGKLYVDQLRSRLSGCQDYKEMSQLLGDRGWIGDRSGVESQLKELLARAAMQQELRDRVRASCRKSSEGPSGPKPATAGR